MELRQLEYFIAVAEELHFGRAANRLKMTQPPLSQQIQQLERDLDVTLLRRTKRHVELTKSGAAFLSEAREILKRVEDAKDIARRVERGQSGRLTVGFVGSATYELLPRVMRSYREQFPDVEVNLRELSTPQQLESLSRREIDIGVLRPPVSSRELKVEVVQREQCVIVLPKNHPLSEQPQISLSDVVDVPFVTVTRSSWPGLYDELMGLCHRLGFSLTVYQEATEFQTVIGLVAAGLGFAVVPASAENVHVREVVYRPLKGLAPTIEMAVAWRTDDVSEIVKNFLAVVKSMTSTFT